MEKLLKNPLDGINPFVRPTSGLPVASVTKDTEDDSYIIERAVVDKVVKTGEGDTDFVIKKELKEISRVNRAEYINSHREDVGILNIIKKVQLTGDATLLNQRSVDIGFADITNLPQDKIDAYKAVEEGVQQFDDLPEDIKKKMSFKQFAEQNDKEFDALINAKVQKVLDEQKKAQESHNNGGNE